MDSGPVPAWRKLGVHWHGFHESALLLKDPRSRSCSRPDCNRGVCLNSPQQAAIWLAESIVQEDGSVYVWDFDSAHWDHLCGVGRSSTIRFEAVLGIWSGRSFYAATRSKWGEHAFAVEVLLNSACPDLMCPIRRIPLTFNDSADHEAA